MGKAARWLRGLLGGRKEGGGDGREKMKMIMGPVEQRTKEVVVSHRRSGRRSSVHAAAAAAATAAAAMEGEDEMRIRHFWAAVKIQAVFRGFLARKALRALKSLVKLQAMVRGFLVRKHAAAMLHRMQALVRAQTIVLNCRSRVLPARDHVGAHRRRSIERCESSYQENMGLVEMDTNSPKWPNRRTTIAPSVCCCCSRDDHLSSPGTPYIAVANQECLPSAMLLNTPRARGPIAPGTPARDGGRLRGPSYMASTRSSTAKVRSMSAPKQRPGSPRSRGGSGAEEEENRRRSCSQAPEGYGARRGGGEDDVGSYNHLFMRR